MSYSGSLMIVESAAKVSASGSFMSRMPKTKALPCTAADAAHIVVGSRCEVQPGGRRGCVKFCGALEGKEGGWGGVELDDPLGKNDGSAGTVRYFTCAENHGTFAKPTNVQCGDFPNELDDSDDDEM